MVEELERCACADDASALPVPPAEMGRASVTETGQERQLTEVPLDAPDYSAYYSESAASAVRGAERRSGGEKDRQTDRPGAPSSRLSTLNGYQRATDSADRDRGTETESKGRPSLSQRAAALVAGKPRHGGETERGRERQRETERGRGRGPQSAAASARDQAAANLAETGELAYLSHTRARARARRARTHVLTHSRTHTQFTQFTQLPQQVN